MAAAALLWSGEALAAEVLWSAPTGCPSTEDVRSGLEQAIHGPLEQAAPLRFAVDVTVESSGAAKLVLRVKDPAQARAPSKRVIEATSCRDAADAAVVAMALALGPDANPDQGKPDESTASKDEDRRVEPAPEESPTGPVRSRHPRKSAASDSKGALSRGSFYPLQVGTEASIVLDAGSLPSLAPGAEVGASLGLRRVGARLTGLVFPERSRTVQGDAGGRFSLLAGTLAVCGRAGTSSLGIETCAGAEFGRLFGTGFGVTDGGDASSRWVAPRMDLTLRLPVGSSSLAAFFRGGVAVPLVRERFTLEHVGFVHRASQAVWRAGVGLSYDL